MADVIQFVQRALPTDGGKARVQRRREVLGINDPDRFHFADSLVMDHADNGMPSDSAYHPDFTGPPGS